MTTAKKAHENAAPKQAAASGPKPDAHPEPAGTDTGLSPIVDRKSYDRLIKAIALRIYVEFERTLLDEGVARPEVSLVGLDLRRAATEPDVRRANYVALNARIVVEKAFADPRDYAARHMPRVMREVEASGDLAGHMEAKVRHDIVMEVRSIAVQHIPEDERFHYRHKFKVL